MSEKRANPIDQMKDWARTAPPADGVRPSEQVLSEISNGQMVAVLLTDKGQAYHLPNVDIAGVTLSRLPRPRSQMNELMDQFGISDGPDWAAAKD